MNKKICFVVMGFGKKMDYMRSREIDSDIIYSKVVKPLFDEMDLNYEVIRADEIAGSSIIDVSMYKLLQKADLVIADITTLNANALYELGIRHALRPFSTIIMMQENDNMEIPFDLNHSRVFTYTNYDEKLNDHEAENIRERLKEYVKQCEEQDVDSPFYTFLPKVNPPEIIDDKEKEIIQMAREREESITKILNDAENFKQKSDFSNAAKKWKKLHELLPENSYVTQQYALARYKSKEPNETIALEEALDIIQILNPQSSLDLETLGIAGAIYKNLYFLNQNYDYLDEAIALYKKGYIIRTDYYNGENYANCSLFKLQKPGLSDEEKNYLKYESLNVYRNIAAKLMGETELLEDDYWMLATLSTACYCIGDLNAYEKYKKKFLERAAADWEKETYKNNLLKLKGILEA